jgi:ligand-binding sensor domain-containing protein
MKKLDIAKNTCPLFNQFLKSNDGNVYATTDDGLYKINDNGVQKLSLLHSPQKTSAVYLGVIAEYKDFLVFTRNELRQYQGLFLYNKKTNTLTEALPELFVFSLKKDYSNVIWLSTDKTVAVLDTLALATGKLKLRTPYTTFINQEFPENGNINFNSQNETLISVGSKGIIRHNKDGTRLTIMSQELSALSVFNFFIDREDVIWICYDGNGIYKLSNTKLRSSASFLRENKSGIKLVRTNFPGTYWVMTSDNRMTLHTSLKDRNFSINIPISPYALFYNDKYLYTATRKELYIAPLPTDNETIIRFREILKLPDSTSFGGHFANDPYGNTILFEQRNICVLKKDKLLFTYPISTYDLIEGMYIDKNKLLWVISRGNGLQVFSLHPEDPFHYLQRKHEFIKEFGNASARCIAVDKNEMLWVGTRYNGLLAFRYKENRLILQQHFQTENGLTDNYITSLACDMEGNIIAGTQTGLDRLIKTGDTSYRIENITKSNNIFSFITMVWTDAANNAFALTNGNNILQAEPVQHAIPGYEPKLLIEEIKVNGKAIADFNSLLRLHHLQRNITFSVAAPSFIDEQQIKYSYLLTGSGNKEWSDTTSLADINLINLSPGNYTLHVKAFFPSTSYSSKETEFSFAILPPWWQTWWFRIAMGILAAGALISSIRFYYRRKLEKQGTILEKQKAIEKERTRIATDMHDDLGAGLSTIRFLSEKVKRNSFSDVTKSDA